MCSVFGSVAIWLREFVVVKIVGLAGWKEMQDRRHLRELWFRIGVCKAPVVARFGRLSGGGWRWWGKRLEREML